MQSMEVVTYGSDILRNRAEEVAEFDDEIRGLIERMYETLAVTRGLGLAAPQIGVSKRVFVYDVGEGQHALVNPSILKTSGEQIGFEGCLSIPGLQGEVTRFDQVMIAGVDEDGKNVKIRADGLLARVFQHEFDHLNGTLFIDRADPDTLETVAVNDEEDEES